MYLLQTESKKWLWLSTLEQGQAVFKYPAFFFHLINVYQVPTMPVILQCSRKTDIKKTD